MASPSARKGLQLGSSNDTRLCPHQRARVLRRQRGLLCQSCKTWFVRGAHRKPRPPQGRWQSCLRVVAFATLGATKIAFWRLWHAIEVPHTPSSATQTECINHAGGPHARASTTGFSRCWLVTPSPRRHEAARANHARAERAVRVCQMGGYWHLVQAHPRVGSALDSFTWVLCSAVCGAVRRTTIESLGAAPEPERGVA